MNNPNQVVRIFIGSSAKNVVEEKVFIHSLLKHSSLPLEINIIDGNTGSVTLHTGEVKRLPSEIGDRIKGATAFSLSRYAIPQWCEYQGKAIYCDSDQICLEDISELWNYELLDAAVAAVHVKEAKSRKDYVSSFLKKLINSEDNYYLTSVMIMDCSKLQAWNLGAIIKSFEQNNFSYTDMMFLGKEFTKLFSTKVKNLPNTWNHLDVLLEDSKLIHFTDLTSQPWLFDHNPVGPFWEKLYLETVNKGEISKEEVLQAYQNGGISRRIVNLYSTNGVIGQYINNFWRTWGILLFALQQLLRSLVFSMKQVVRALIFSFKEKLT